MTRNATPHTVKLLSFDNEELLVKCIGIKAKVTVRDYGLTVQDETREWALDVLCTTRQDGRTSWLVALTSVDGTVETRNGLTPTHQAHTHINKAIAALTAHWLPQYRLNSK